MEKETIENLIEYSSANDRICPMPPVWNDMYNMLKDTQHASEHIPPLPLILGAWWNTTEAQKKDRLKLHLEWAQQKEQLEEIGVFLRSLSEDKWAHKKDF